MKFFYTITFISIITLLIFYIFQVNIMVQETYLIQNYENKLETYNQENENLIVNSVQLNSLGGIKNKVEEFGFKEVGKIHYIRILNNQIVTK